MAENNVPHPENRRKYEVSDDRCDVVMDATYEIEQLCELAMEQANRSQSFDAILFRGLAARIGQLNSSIMSAIGEKDHPLADLRVSVRGRPLADQAA